MREKGVRCNRLPCVVCHDSRRHVVTVSSATTFNHESCHFCCKFQQRFNKSLITASRIHALHISERKRKKGQRPLVLLWRSFPCSGFKGRHAGSHTSVNKLTTAATLLTTSLCTRHPDTIFTQEQTVWSKNAPLLERKGKHPDCPAPLVLAR